MLSLKIPLNVLNNPSREELRRLAQEDETPTAFNAPAYYTQKAASRSAQFTYYLNDGPLGKSQRAADPKMTADVEQFLDRQLKELELIQIDRVIGNNTQKNWHCRLLIPKQYARLALMWSGTLFAASPRQRAPAVTPDFLPIDLPNWPEAFDNLGNMKALGPKGIFILPDKGCTYILGTDYVGEVKMSFLRQAMYQMKRLGGLGLHAGSKVIKIKSGKALGSAGARLEEIGVLLFGLSGTGKTTLTLDSHGLGAPEGIELLQDDIVWLTQNGQAFGTEDNFYVKTEGINEENQPTIFHALFNDETVFENVAVNGSTKQPELNNYSRGTNGRALVMRQKIRGSSDRINLAKVHKIFFITRRDTVVPPVARLNSEQAGAYFMLGESIETSAGDPTKAGEAKHEVGFNPFIVGVEEEEGRRLAGILKANNIECYLLNTGSLGKGGDIPNQKERKITQVISSKIIEAVVRGTIPWIKDPRWGYDVAADIAGVPEWRTLMRPEPYYSPALLERLTLDLLKERKAFLAQYHFELPTGQ